MKEYLLKTYNYSHWANQILIECIEKNNIQDDFVIKTISHLLNAQRIWYNRLHPENATATDLWAVHSLEKLKIKNDALAELYFKWISGLKLKDFAVKHEITNFKGETYYNSLIDILIHVANHDAHHRGQIARKIREIGVEPPNFDYAIFMRIFPDFW